MASTRRPTRFEAGSGNDALTGEGHISFSLGGPFFLEGGETRRFHGYPDIESFGIHADFPLRIYAVDARGRRTWGEAVPVVRLMVGPDPPLTDEDPEELKALLRPNTKTLRPWRVEPRWKLWKRRELRNPTAWRPP